MNQRMEEEQCIVPKIQQVHRGRNVRYVEAIINHGIWASTLFKEMDVPKRWKLAKEKKLCYCCLALNHFSKDCTRKKTCSKDSCKLQHHSLLHEEKQKTSFLSSNKKEISLRTILVVVKNGKKKLIVNALLDDRSTEPYTNRDVVAQLGLSMGEVEEIKVNVLNGQVDTFETMPVTVIVESLDGKVNIKFTANTTDKVTGRMKAVDWNKYKQRWEHLKDVAFSTPVKKSLVDILIGINYADLQFKKRNYW